ncbi:MAG: YafY family protein [Thermodesulfobacteriota bacterium]
MRRADRLFEIIQILRRRRVVKARELAERLEVSERTIYRDVQALVASRVPIDGEAGVGYSLRKGYDLPPLMFREDELEALVFGARIVKSWSDSEMARAAEAALERIEPALPEHLRHLLADTMLWVPESQSRVPLSFDLARLRAMIRESRKLRFRYTDEKGAETERTVWPLVLCFYGPVWLAGTWCELRRDFRFFRLDRMNDVRFLDQVFPSERGRTADDLLRLVFGAKSGRISPDSTLAGARR